MGFTFEFSCLLGVVADISRHEEPFKATTGQNGCGQSDIPDIAHLQDRAQGPGTYYCKVFRQLLVGQDSCKSLREKADPLTELTENGLEHQRSGHRRNLLDRSSSRRIVLHNHVIPVHADIPPLYFHITIGASELWICSSLSQEVL